NVASWTQNGQRALHAVVTMTSNWRFEAVNREMLQSSTIVPSTTRLGQWSIHAVDSLHELQPNPALAGFVEDDLAHDTTERGKRRNASFRWLLASSRRHHCLRQHNQGICSEASALVRPLAKS